ncbi:MAG: ATPase [Alphaproteobacteria bacterium]|nr:MAG: ATPase [Alphaproteobacteria bacterium]
MNQMDEKPHIIVLGNEKGGSGKSTTAMHLLIALAARGLKVAAIDLDVRQRTLARYLENRRRHVADKGVRLVVPDVVVVEPAVNRDAAAGGGYEERARFEAAIARFRNTVDVLVIDCPGHDSRLSRLAHARAHTLITPVNDSFVDLDLLAHVHPETYRIERPSLYAELVWEARKQRAMEQRRELDWIVMRNRVASLDARNKRRVDQVLRTLAKRVGFRYVAGLSERVIYRELFPKGLTLVDFGNRLSDDARPMTMSHLAARQELRHLVDELRLPHFAGKEEACEEARTA